MTVRRAEWVAPPGKLYQVSEGVFHLLHGLFRAPLLYLR